MKVPFIDLKSQHAAIADEVNAAITRVMESGQFVGGEEISSFENSFAQQLGTNHCIGTGNGTDSLFLILKALGIGPGDEVITPAFSCFPSAEVISLCGASVIFCDVDPLYYTIDVDNVIDHITPRTKAVIAVHLYGQAAPVDRLKAICEAENIHLIEDCAQSHRTALGNKFAGTFGVGAAFSFYPTKNLGAIGDAGAIVTSNDTLAERVRRLANHGALDKYDHQLEGMNSRLDALQAAVLSVKLKHLKAWNEKRYSNAQRYHKLLSGMDNIVLPAERDNSKHTYHIFCIRSESRDSLQKHLLDHGISTLIHYPEALPFTTAYKYLEKRQTDFPVSFQLQNEVLSLPIFPELSESQIEFVADTIKRYL